MKITVVLVHRPEMVDDGDDPFDAVEALQVFVDTDPEIVQDYMLQINAEYPDWQLMMDSCVQIWSPPAPERSCAAGTCINHQDCARARINAKRALKGLPPKWQTQQPQP